MPINEQYISALTEYGDLRLCCQWSSTSAGSVYRMGEWVYLGLAYWSIPYITQEERDLCFSLLSERPAKERRFRRALWAVSNRGGVRQLKEVLQKVEKQFLRDLERLDSDGWIGTYRWQYFGSSGPSVRTRRTHYPSYSGRFTRKLFSDGLLAIERDWWNPHDHYVFWDPVGAGGYSVLGYVRDYDAQPQYRAEPPVYVKVLRQKAEEALAEYRQDHKEYKAFVISLSDLAPFRRVYPSPVVGFQGGARGADEVLDLGYHVDLRQSVERGVSRQKKWTRCFGWLFLGVMLCASVLGLVVL